MANEAFDAKKFVRGLNPFSLVGWAKKFAYTFRVAIIAGLVFLGLFGYGYWKGYKNRPVQVNMADARIIIDSADGQHELIIKDGKMTFDGKPIAVKNIEALKPYGIELRPKVVAGVTSSGSPAAGLGLEVAHAYKFNLDLLALYKFLGIGVSYDLHLEKPFKIDSSSIGLGVGRDFTADENAVILYYSIQF